MLYPYNPGTVTAFCPGHISGYFKQVMNDSTEYSGSIGGGIVIGEGVRVVASKDDHSSVEIFRTDCIGVPTLTRGTSEVITDLLERLDVKARIQTYSHLPDSCGYGMSAAALLATVHAVNTLYGLEMNASGCTLMAHEIEISHKTGLGDVSACQGGGFVVRKTPGPLGSILRFQDRREIYAVTSSSLSTSKILTSPGVMERIRKAYPDDIPETIEDLMRISREFAEKSGLISGEVRQILSACDAQTIPASMTMLGNGVFALGKGAPAVLKTFGEVYRLQISAGGPRILTGEGVHQL
jgi:pantoate kinase